jgi:hypothetical protein
MVGFWVQFARRPRRTESSALDAGRKQDQRKQRAMERRQSDLEGNRLNRPLPERATEAGLDHHLTNPVVPAALEKLLVNLPEPVG